MLHFPGEEALIGLGVSYCATCDGPLYRGADVLAYGHSEEAVEDVLALAQVGCRVRWLPGVKQDKVPAELIARVTKAGVPILWETKVKSLEGQGRLQKVVLERGGAEEEAAVTGLFIFREVPTGPLFSKAGLKLDHKGCIAVDRCQRTNLAGVFAAGDVTCCALQVVAAAGEGCSAALQALAYLRT